MGVLKISAEDMLRSEVVKPGWYPVSILDYSEDFAKTDNSVLHVFKAKIADGEFAGVPLRIQFSEKAPGFAKNFILALGGKLGKEGGDFKMEAAVGKKLKAHVSNQLYKGNMQNVVDDYQPLS